ncbi:hypothetical protein RF11_14589 [Thelohanellus kitauei]|uniref:Uncharacterized protein n=1 Tax=Thelohanellus kitauei TaxID=669202 RepID=A0A0C2N465_THEKT|nr:hypothetical protein RF11_14589 [Thelohanellus kitauei]
MYVLGICLQKLKTIKIGLADQTNHLHQQPTQRLMKLDDGTISISNNLETNLAAGVPAIDLQSLSVLILEHYFYATVFSQTLIPVKDIDATTRKDDNTGYNREYARNNIMNAPCCNYSDEETLVLTNTWSHTPTLLMMCSRFDSATMETWSSLLTNSLYH